MSYTMASTVSGSYGFLSMPAWHELALLVLAYASVMFTVYYYSVSVREAKYRLLADLWNDLLAICLKNPDFRDASKTTRYAKFFEGAEASKYASYCQKAWGLFEDIVHSKNHEHRQFQPTLDWIVALHLCWLDDNPHFFRMPEFWREVDKRRKERHAMAVHVRQPLNEDGSIDWEKIHRDYFTYTFSPFDPRMLGNPGHRTQIFLDYLYKRIQCMHKQERKKIKVADFGGGSGSLIGALAPCETASEFYIFDKSNVGLENAKRAGGKAGYDVTVIQMDFDDPRPSDECQFQIVVSVNSVVAGNREQAQNWIKLMADSVAPNGEFIAILPSFDTVESLMELWKDFYTRKGGFNSSYGARVIASIKRQKKLNLNEQLYADSGDAQQFYLRCKDVKTMISDAGLEIVQGPKRIYYPWEYSWEFDYGYFESKCEIYDWFVAARKP